ncbi:MAG: hypothetical protein SGBAC_007141 [Bacillariaceae sp.]
MNTTEAARPLLQHQQLQHDQELGYGGMSSDEPTITIDDVSSSSDNSSSSQVTIPITPQKRQRRLLLAMTLILPYIGLVIALLAANNFDQDTVIEKFYFLPFHMYEFWGSVYFALVEGYILLVADDNSFLALDQSSQSTLVHMLSINVVSTMVAASLFTLNPSIFEVPSHYIEYTSQVTVTFIDAYFMMLPRNGSKHLRDRRKMGDRIPTRVQQGYFVLLLLADVAKFLLYANLLPTLTASIGNERSSHYVEFTVELLNSLWAFVYIKDLYIQSLWQQK